MIMTPNSGHQAFIDDHHVATLATSPLPVWNHYLFVIELELHHPVGIPF